MTKLPLSILTVTLIAAAHVKPVYSDDPPPTPRRLIAARAATAPTVDGRLDDACWKQAAQAGRFSVFSNADSLHPEQTIGRVCYDDDNLYIAMECAVNAMDKFNSRMIEAAGKFEYGKGGCIEVFLDVNHDQETFQQYLLHPNGSSMMTLSKGDIFKILNEDHLINRGLVTDTGYNVEMSFPLAMLHLHPDTAKVWGFNLNRSHDLYDERHDRNGFFSSWNSTIGHGFQTPKLFGELVMDIDLSRYYWQVDFVREPQPGDDAVRFRIVNETGKDFAGAMTLKIGSDEKSPADYRQPVNLAAGATGLVTFAHFVKAADLEADYEISIVGNDGSLRYIGGTQKKDLTPGDEWPATPPTAAEQTAGIQIFQRPLTTPVLYRAVPRREEMVSSLAVAACRGEFEPVTFSIHPLRDLKAVTVKVSDLLGTDGDTVPAAAVDVRRVSWQSDWDNPRQFLARAHLLRRFESIALAKGRTQRFWLTIEVPETARPGDYRGTVTMTADGLDTTLPLTLEVHPFELSAPDEMGYFMYYPGVPNHPAISTREFFRKTLEDMRDHGMTTFSIYNWIKIDDPETGRSRIDVDDRVADNYGVTYAQMMESLRDAGFGSIPLLDVYSMHYKPEQIVELDKICRERGWPEVLFYIEDEIEYPERIARARKTLEAVRKISPDIKTTTAIGPKGAAALGHMYDVWIGCSTPEMVEKCRGMEKAPWTYSCRKTVDVGPAFERTFFGRFAWKIGLKGVSLWSYGEDNTFFDRFGRASSYKEFRFSPEWRQQYGHVFFEDGEIVPSVTWEAVREGIDDYRYMLTLKKIMDSVQDDRTDDVRQAANAGLVVLRDIAERTPIIADDKKYGRAWQELGDADGDRAAVVAAILNVRKAADIGD